MSATRYADGLALWRALADRARLAARDSGRPANELVRRFVYDRFLARVFVDPSAPWVLKGGTAVLARVVDARHSKDVDLLRTLGTTEDALDALRAATAVDLHDHFRFVVRAVRTVGGAVPQPGIAGFRVQVDAYCDVRRCESFGVDLVTGSLMTAEPDVVRASTPIDLPGLPAPLVRAYPAVDHVADKLAATESRYGDGAPSTRTRDLVDLVVLARTQAVDGDDLHAAIVAERLHRSLPAVHGFTVPPGWATTYPPLAARTRHCEGLPDIGSATRFVATFLEPAMSGTATARRWVPADAMWTPRST